MLDGVCYFCFVWDVSKLGGVFDVFVCCFVIGLGCEVKYVFVFVYVDYMDIDMVEVFELIGIFCWICECKICY